MNGAKLYHGRYVACRSGVTAGAALILTLACIVILTALVLLFLTHSLLETQVSVASADQTAASLFARGAVDSVIGEFKQEIAAGSATPFSPTGSDLRDPNTVFLPATNLAMVPYRMDAGAPANVLKRSSYNEPFYAGSFYNLTTWPAPQWAVNFSSTNTANISGGGRYVSLARWNEPLLMPTTNIAGSGATGTWPVATFIPPDWIYVTRTAGPATTFSSALIPNTVSGLLNTNCVVGRYAYVVYDEGGLLDANAAGYPYVALDGTSITPAMMRHKISEACADLTQIGLNPSDITNLVAWRNPNNDATATTYTNYVYSAATNAFLTPASGERIFTSRQQLIDFLTQNVAQSSTDIERMQGALPYLTTFSRELNAPSWYPQTNMTSAGYKYMTLATNTPASATNAFTPLERSGSMYTNLSGLVCDTNQPAALSRFPLSRLSWLTTNGVPPAGVTAAQIQQAFGLVWDSSNGGNNCAWIYAGPLPNTTVQSSISALNAIKGREPNFFETLKAGILSGSVGVTPAAQVGSIPSAGGIDSRYTNSDQQVMQIGMAAIDQASPAPLPTRIEFGANTTSDWNSALYGTKPIPYIYKMVFSGYRPSTMPADVVSGTPYNNQYFTAWEEPVFWSPYQVVTTNTAPLQIRIRADGTNNGTYGNMGSDTDAESGVPGSPTANNLYVSCIPEIPCGPAGSGTTAGGANGATIELDSGNESTINGQTATPVLLSSLVASGYSPVINDLRAQSSSVTVTWPNFVSGNSSGSADIYTESGCTYAGFWLGMALAPNSPDPDHAIIYNGTVATSTISPYSQAEFYSGIASHRSTQQFLLEANYGTTGSPIWQEVQRMRFSYGSHAGDVEENDGFTSIQRRLAFLTINDPRTGRFSFDLAQPQSYSATGVNSAPSTVDANAVTWTTYPYTTNYFTGRINYIPVTSASATVVPSWASGANPSTYIDSFRFADNTANGSANTTPMYQDTDGAQRQADGWWFNTQGNSLPMREDTMQDSPVFLGRPFYSVGELGYVSRDMPWRSLNFSSTNSPDAGLLDFFSINDGYAGNTNYPSLPVVAGVVDLNTRNPQVLQALLSGAERSQLYPTYDIGVSTPADVTNIANAITNMTWNSTTPLPLLNKSELATRIAPNDPTVLAVSSPSMRTQTTYDTNIKERREAVVRALASAGQVRTWNLLIDVVAQTGHLPPGATGFNNFSVTAEQRYWAHVAIDRYTGQVVSMQLEPVSE